MSLFQLVYLLTDDLSFLHLLLDLLFIALVESDVVVELGANLVEELIETACILGQAPMLWIHRHDGQAIGRGFE